MYTVADNRVDWTCAVGNNRVRFPKQVFLKIWEEKNTKLYLSFCVDLLFMLSCIVRIPILGLIQDIPSKKN